MKRTILAALTAASVLTGPALAADSVKVGISGGDSEIIWEKVKEVAAQDDLDVELVVFSDYLLPNEALAAGDLDANAFQHKPFLDNQIATKGYDLTPIGETIVAPIGLYSNRVQSVDDLPEGASVGIPNDPSNGGRALLLLQAEGLIELRDGVGILPTVLDVTANPKNLELTELDAAQLPRSLDDLDASVINTNYAVQAGLTPGEDSIAIEATEGNPYTNYIVVRTEDKDDPVFRRLVAAYQSDTVREVILAETPGQFPAF